MHTAFLDNYVPILVFVGLAVGISVIMIALSWIRGPSNPTAPKKAAYECGFDALSTPRVPFNIHFYLVAILFIIFDLEIAFLFPWALTLGDTGAFGFGSMMIFLGTLTVGFFYEWKKGALEWE